MQSRPLEHDSSVQRHKIAIPRLDREPFPPPESNKRKSKDRTSRACKTCRKRKIKCSGDVPDCKSCRAAESVCVYEQSRRDRLREATSLNHTLASLLKKLSDRANDEEKKEIIDALEDAEDDILSKNTEASLEPSGNWKQPAVEDEQETREDGETHVGGATGSNEGVDYLDEDLTKTLESRATGYIGHNSEVRWLRSVQRQTEHTGAEPHAPPYGPPGSSQKATNARSDALHTRRDNARQSSRQGSIKRITESSFYLDGSAIDVDIVVDPYDVPDPEAAEQLFDCYIRTVHSSFPLVSETFQDQFYRYMESIRNGGAFLLPDKWRAHMNLLFAIGAKYSHLIGAEWRGDERDHLVYMTRAMHLLGLKDVVMAISGPDLELVQATGTLSFYFLVIGHVSRAWITIGIALRLALALGLHLRNEDSTVGAAKKDALAEFWWSLHSIECLLSSVTGRPPVVATEYCTVPLPRSSPGIYQESSGASRGASYRRTDGGLPLDPRSGDNPEFGKRIPPLERYRVSRIKVSLIAQKALLHLYSPLTATQSWNSIQTKISDLLNDLEEWRVAALSKDSGVGPMNYETEFEREQFLLKIEYWSTKILITRPCLCRLERRIRHQSNTSANFDANAAEACVNAASEIVELFPEQPNLDYIYSNGPWWVIIHIIMQSTAVLLLEMAYKAQDITKDSSSATRSIRKLIRWLQAMQDNDLVAARAYEVVWRILKACAPVLQAEVNKILALDGEEDSQANSLQRPQNEQATACWQHRDFFQNPMVSSGTFDPSAFYQQPFDPLFEYQPVTHTSSFANQNSTPMPFGNPFFTSFDQIVPVVNIQDLWSSPPISGHFRPDISILDHAQGQQEVPHNPETDPMFQQQY